VIMLCGILCISFLVSGHLNDVNAYRFVVCSQLACLLGLFAWYYLSLVLWTVDLCPVCRTQPAMPTPLQGTALFLLERYSDAESAYLEGLALHPDHKTLQDGLKQVQEVLAEQEKEQQQLLAEVRRTGVAAAGSNHCAAAAAAGGTADAGKADGSSAAARSAAAAAAAGGSSSSPSRAYAEGPGSSEEAAAAAAAAGGSAAKR
jgi:hypothetical protein